MTDRDEVGLSSRVLLLEQCDGIGTVGCGRPSGVLRRRQLLTCGLPSRASFVDARVHDRGHETLLCGASRVFATGSLVPLSGFGTRPCRMRIALAAPGAHDPVVRGSGFRQRAEYRFGLVLLLLLVTFTFMAAGLTGAWTGVVAVLLQGATLIAALSAAEVARGLVRLAALVTVVALVIAATAPISGSEPSGFVALLSALLVGLAPVAIAWSIVRRRRIDVQTVLGALCIYVLLGMFWAFASRQSARSARTPSSLSKRIRRAPPTSTSRTSR